MSMRGCMLCAGVLMIGGFCGNHARGATFGDYDGDGRTDLAIYVVHAEEADAPYDPDTTSDYWEWQEGQWHIWLSDTESVMKLLWGGPGFMPVPGDFDGNGYNDLAAYHEAAGIWYILSMPDGEILHWAEDWGGPGWLPVSGDFDGDGRSDPAVYKEETGTWNVRSVDGDMIYSDHVLGGLGSIPVGGIYAESSIANAADLALHNFVFLPAKLAANGHPDVVAFRLTNIGPINMESRNTRVHCDFFLSRNATFGDADDIWIGDYSADVTLKAGDHMTVILTKKARDGITIPVGASGDYHVFVRVRHAEPSTLADPDLSNNHARRAHAVTITGDAQVQRYVINDFNGDGRSDIVVFDLAGRYWYVFDSTTLEPEIFQFGGPGGIPMAGDYDGDGKADPAVYHEATGFSHVKLSGSDYNEAFLYGFGGPGWMPVSGDYDGDGKTDIAIYNEATGDWRVLLSWSGYGQTSLGGFGGAGFSPVAGDFDGDGKMDPAIYNEATGDWHVLLSGSGYGGASLAGFGGQGWMPAFGDFDGDGKMDPAIYNEATGDWRVLLSGSDYGEISLTGFGGPGWMPVSCDFDCDGRTDLAIYQEATGNWRILLSGSDYGEISLTGFGGPGFVPVAQRQ